MTVNRTPLTSLVFLALCIGTLSSDARSLMQSVKQNSRVLIQAVAKSPFFVSRLDIKPLGNIFKVPQKVISCTDTAFPAGDFFFFFFGHALLIWNLNSLSWKWIAKIVQVKVITHAESLISIRLCAVRFSWILFWFIYCFCWPLRWHPGVATSPSHRGNGSSQRWCYLPEFSPWFVWWRLGFTGGLCSICLTEFFFINCRNIPVYIWLGILQRLWVLGDKWALKRLLK